MATKKSGTSSTKTNVKRVTKAVSKYDTSKSVQDNAEAIGGVVTATATSAKRSKTQKQKTFFIVLLVIVIIAIVGTLIYGYYNGWFDSLLGKEQTEQGSTGWDNPPSTGGNDDTPGTGGNDGAIADMSIHFIDFGNSSSGDCVYIKAGDTDILIDGGSTQNSASVIQQYVDKYCSDGILEYVIVTHSDTDHIYAFTTSASSGGGIFERYECKTIIDFNKVKEESATLRTYYARRDAEVAAGANHYTALECYNNENGAQRIYDLADGITMEILYQKFYEQVSSDNNNHSVCVMFTQGDNHYLFTGDLEKAGEESLVASNPNLPEVELFKAGHHGSATSTNDVLLRVIKPKYVIASCVAGDRRYGFPRQDFIDRVAPYTDNVYITMLHPDDQPTMGSMNGNIVFSCVDGVIEVHGSNNDLKLKDTEWFKQNRVCPDAWKTE